MILCDDINFCVFKGSVNVWVISVFSIVPRGHGSCSTNVMKRIGTHLWCALETELGHCFVRLLFSN